MKNSNFIIFSRVKSVQHGLASENSAAAQGVSIFVPKSERCHGALTGRVAEPDAHNWSSGGVVAMSQLHTHLFSLKIVAQKVLNEPILSDAFSFYIAVKKLLYSRNIPGISS